MFIIPKDRKWSQTNASDLSGNVQRTRNISFDDEGIAKLAKRARSIHDFSGTNDRRILWIEYFKATNKYWLMVLDSNAVYSVDGTTLAVTDESGTSNIPSPDTTGGRNDCVPWQGYLYATSTVSLRRYNGSGWSANQYAAGITDGGFLCVNEAKNWLAISQGNQVLLINTSHTLQHTLTLPSEFQVTSMDYNNGFIAVGTRNINNGEAKMFLWDGNSSQHNSDWGVGCPRIDSVRRYKNTYVLVNSLGQLLQFNGGGFTQIGAFPIYYKDADWDADGSSYLGRVINRGMRVDGDLIYINVSPRIILPAADLANHVFESYFEGGVWVYDPEVGLHHRYCHTSSLRVSNTIATSAVDTGTNTITVSSAPASGTPVIYDSSSGSAISGLANRTKYYAIYVSATTMKLATTYANAIAGTPISLGGTGNSSQLLIFVPNRDFGGSTLGGNLTTNLFTDAAGALTFVANRELAYRTDASLVMFGTRIGKTVVNGSYGLAVATWGQENRGFIMTPKLKANSLVDNFQNISVKYRNVKTIEDKIIVKYRTLERNDTLSGIDQALTMTATWVNTTQFTTTADLSSAKKGDEVSFHSGSGSGYMVHISSISESGGTYTVNLDEVVQNVTGGDTVGFVIENWNKIGTITNVSSSDTDNETFTNDNLDRYVGIGGVKTFNLLKNSKQIEIKLELRGEDVAIEDILVNNVSFKRFIA